LSREQVDAVIVGAGASGGVVAHELAHAGLRVALLEARSKVEREGFSTARRYDLEQ
jgi:choline dehydrogenase-like flavoprotein